MVHVGFFYEETHDLAANSATSNSPDSIPAIYAKKDLWGGRRSSVE
jgi:hypothetical protein